MSTSTIVPAPVPDFASRANIAADKSGKASDPTVWSLGRALQAGDYVWIPSGLTVIWDLTTSPRLAGIVFAGTLDTGSAPGDKQMILADLICLDGTYKCGSCISNTPLNGTFTLTFTDTAPDPVFDPGQFGTGFLTMGGMIDECGAANKTAWVLSQGVAVAANQITMLQTPVGWNVGDEILLPPTQYSSPSQAEVVKIASIVGNTLNFASPTQFDHSVPVLNFGTQSWTTGTVSVNVTHSLVQNTDNSVTVTAIYTWKDSVSGQGDTYTNSFTWQKASAVDATHVSPCLAVGNLTRNIVWQSENPNGTRGHFMLMKGMGGMPTIDNSCHIDQRYMGRTDASKPVTDPMVDTSFSPPQLVAGSAANPRARYARHSHRQGQGTGYGDTSTLQTWDGIVVRFGRKWAFDNHDSNVECTNCIAYDFQGAGFATERGTEIGVYSGCLAVGGTGIGDGENHDLISNDGVTLARFDDDDMGFIGNGFWLQGSGVEVGDCVAAGCVGAGFYWAPMGSRATQANPPGVIANNMPWANLSPAQQKFFAALPTPYSATNPPPIRSIPLQGMSNNQCFASGGAAMMAWGDFLPDSMYAGNPATIDKLTSFNCVAGVGQQYIFSVGFSNSVHIGPHVAGAKVGLPTGFNAAPPFIGNNVNPSYGQAQFATNCAYIGWDKGYVKSYFPDGPFADGYYANIADFWVPVHYGAPPSDPYRFSLTGNPIFGGLQLPVPAGQERLNFLIATESSPAYDPAAKSAVSPLSTADLTTFFDANQLFHATRHLLSHGWQLYFGTNASGYIPFPVQQNGIPPSLVGMTADQFAQKGQGLWQNGVVSPAPCPWTSNGIIGAEQNWGSYTATTYPYYAVVSSVLPNDPNGYVLIVEDFAGSAAVQTFPAVNLQPGWNFFAETVNNIPCEFAVYGLGSSPPAPPPSPPPSPPPPPVLAAPTGLWGYSRQVSLAWNPVAGATYNLRRSPDGMTWTTVATGLTTTSFIDTTVGTTGTFSYEVQASNAQGVSPWSGVVQIAVP